jgi:hypothetical protein
MARIGEAAAHFLETTLQTDEIIGVSSWSETILKMVDNIHPMKAGKARYVVQTLGGIGDPTVQIHANQLTTRLARLTGAEAHLLSAPASRSRAKGSLCFSATLSCGRRWISSVRSLWPSSESARWRRRTCLPGPATSSPLANSPQ